MKDKTMQRPGLPRRAPYRRLGLVLLTTISLGACTSAYENPDARTFGEFTDDVALVSKVKAKLIGHKSIAGLRINVDVYRRQVTLTGRVDSQVQKDLAVTLAKSVKGVAGVTSRLE